MRATIVAALLLSGTLLAQNKDSTQTTSSQTASDKDIQLLREDIRSQKKQIVAANMTLTDAEAVKFWPVYDQYTAQMQKVNDKRLTIIKDYAAGYPNFTDAQAQNLVNRWLAADEEAMQMRMQFMPTVEKVLPGKKAALFFQIERRLDILMNVQLSSEVPLVSQ
ncbi:MAG TPA: hypothetical protein VH596_08500 [Terriglobales bacterium]|jgi:hypothetical protein